MGLVLWIDQNTFATGLLEKVFKKKNLPFYTLESAEDFSYLVDDLRPELVVLDHQTALNHLTALQHQYAASPRLQQLPFVIIGGEFPFIKKTVGKINRPFDPFVIPEELQKILAAI
jgi:DNA-binding NtrC family response regulator